MNSFVLDFSSVSYLRCVFTSSPFFLGTLDFCLNDYLRPTEARFDSF